MKRRPSPGSILGLSILCFFLIAMVYVAFFQEKGSEPTGNIASLVSAEVISPSFIVAEEEKSSPSHVVSTADPANISVPVSPVLDIAERPAQLLLSTAIQEASQIEKKEAVMEPPVRIVQALPAAEELPEEAEVVEPPAAVLEKISISYGMEQEYYTIQAASYAGIGVAENGYALLEKELRGAERNLLRIEKVGAYYTLRLGRDERVTPLRELLAKVQMVFPSAHVLSAYIKKERIVKVHDGFFPDQERAAPEVVWQAAVEEAVEDMAPVVSKEIAPESENLPAVEQEELTVEDTVEELLPAEEEKIVTEEKEPEIQTAAELNAVVEDETTPRVFSYKAIKAINQDEFGNRLQFPSSLFYDQTRRELYVVIGGEARVLVFDQDYSLLISFGKGRGVPGPQGISVDSAGRIYVGQSKDGEDRAWLTILNAALFVEKDIFIGDIPGAEKFFPDRLALGKDGTIYVVGVSKNPGVLVLDSQGDFLRWLTVVGEGQSRSAGSERRETVSIKDVETGADGRIYLLSEETSKIYVYSPDEEFLFSFGSKGGSSGKTSRPRGLALDEKRQYIYVADYMRHTILIYDFTGKYLTEFSGKGNREGWLNYPTDIAVDHRGRVIVADFFNHRVQIFDRVEDN